jgi:hypothetical protein
METNTQTFLRLAILKAEFNFMSKQEPIMVTRKKLKRSQNNRSSSQIKNSNFGIYSWLFLLVVKLLRLEHVINSLKIQISLPKSNTVKILVIKVCENLTLNGGYFTLTRAKNQSPKPPNSF